MSRALVLLRPEPGWSESAVRARDLGMVVVGAPLFAIEPVAWSCPDPASFDGLLVGSANVFRHGGSALAGLRSLPVHAVGAATGAAALDGGFTVASLGSGGLQAVLDCLAPQRLLRLAGEAHVPLTLPEGATMETRILYRSRPVPLAAEAATALAQGAFAALHSAEAARHFASECDRLGLPRETIDLAALGPRIAAAAGRGWRSIHIAEAPDDAALLAKAQQMCQTRT